MRSEIRTKLSERDRKTWGCEIKKRPQLQRKQRLAAVNEMHPGHRSTLARRDARIAELEAELAALKSTLENRREPSAAPDSHWRNRAEFINGRAAIEAFLRRKWARELDYRLIKDVWAHAGNRIAVRFAYEYHDDSGTWFRAYGNENWQFDADGLMERRIASINEHPIGEADRKFHWLLGRRPDSHPGLTGIGL